MKQVIESEKKIKLASLLKHSGVTLDRITASDEQNESMDSDECIFEFDCSTDFEMSEAELQIVYFVAGYCAKRLKGKLSCNSCKKIFVSDFNLPFADAPTEFFDSLNRGGLKAPGNELYILLCAAYEIFCKIKTSPQFDTFLRLKNPRDTYVSTVMQFVEDKQFLCESNHDLKSLYRFSLLVFFNCLARNFLRNLCMNKSNVDEKKIRKLRSTK